MAKDHHRFADEELQLFYQQFADHCQDYDDKVKADFIERQKLHASLCENTEALNRMCTNTEGLIEAWNNAQGFLRTIAFISKWIKIIAPIGGAIALVWYILKTGHIPPSNR